jgi:hypothetical protein
MAGDEARNWFADESLAQDPYPFLAELRSLTAARTRG